MIFEYKALKGFSEKLESKINRFAREGWRIHSYEVTPHTGAIECLMERLVQEQNKAVTPPVTDEGMAMRGQLSARRIPTYDDIPEPIQKAFRAPWNPVIEEEILEREVAARAILDALGHTGEPDADDHNKALLDAREWFRAGESVYAVFENAGLHVDNLRSVMMDAIKKKRRGL